MPAGSQPLPLGATRWGEQGPCHTLTWVSLQSVCATTSGNSVSRKITEIEICYLRLYLEWGGGCTCDDIGHNSSSHTLKACAFTMRLVSYSLTVKPGRTDPAAAGQGFLSLTPPETGLVLPLLPDRAGFPPSTPRKHSCSEQGWG